MKKCNTLKEFIRNSILCISSGYTTYRIATIPQKKRYKKPQILKNIEKTYQTNLTRSQRYYAKKKGFANFKAVQYKELVLICYTNGEIKQEIDLGKGWADFNKKSRLRLNISDYISIDVFRDERKKLTAKMSKELLTDTKAEIKEAFKTRNGFRFHNILKKWHSLPTYRGFQLQKKDLVFFINGLKKDNKQIKWTVPFTYL